VKPGPPYPPFAAAGGDSCVVQVPTITAVCNCPVGAALTGDNMHLECPDGEVEITDYMWQVCECR
jgi:hypothetical protein